MEIVRKKQMRKRIPMRTTKKKLDGASNPSQPENLASGSGKMAIIRQASGRRSQAREFLMDKEFFFKKIKIKANEKTAATDISIWRLVIFFPS